MENQALLAQPTHRLDNDQDRLYDKLGSVSMGWMLQPNDSNADQ